MRTILTRIFSLFLAGAATLSVAAAPQLMGKVNAGAQNRPSVAAKAASEKAPMLLEGLQTRTFKTGTTFRSALSGAQYMPTKVNVPMKAAGDVPTNMYGSIVYSDLFTSSSQVGLYTIPATADGESTLLVKGVNAQYGGVEVEGIYYTSTLTDILGIFQTYDITGYDMETGAKVFAYSGQPDVLFPGGVTYDATTGNVYAISYTADGAGYQFAKVAFGDNTATITPIAAINENFNALAAAPDGTIYGISFVKGSKSTLVKFDKTTGTYTEVGVTGMLPNYLSSAAIDPKTGRMFWNVCAADETGTLCEVDLTTGQASLIYQFPGNDEIMGLTIPAPLAEDKAPAVAENLVVSFPNGTLSGKVSFDAPKTLFNGTRAFGSLDYKVLVDGETVAEGKTTYGGSVEVNVTIAEAGYHTFIVTTSNKVGQSPKLKDKVFVGNGIPAAPKVTATWANGVATLSWSNVTTSADGGYINPDEVTYTIIAYPEEKVLAQNVATNIFSVRLPMPEQQTVYSYGVTATFDGKTSAEGVSNALILGDIIPPYQETFDTADALAAWTLVDANGDNRKFTWYQNSVRMQYNISKDMDDWMISPAIKLKAGQACYVSIDAKGYLATSPEKFEMYYGKSNTVAAMTNVLVPETTIESDQYATYGAYMVAETDGLYYVGIHGCSVKNMWYLYVDNFTLGDLINAGVPQKVTDLVVTPGANGALNATVEFTTPTLNMLGEALTEISKMEILRGDDVVLELNGAVEPGKKYTVADNNIPAAGDYVYTVNLYNSYGLGEVATFDAYIGINYPAAPEGLGIQESEDIKGGVTVYWDPITTTETGEPLAASDVTYEVYDYDGSSFTKLADGLTQTYYSYLAVSGNNQDFKQYAVFGVTQRGRGEGQVTSMVPVGTAYKNFNESFANGTLNYIFGISSVPGADGRASWSLGTDSAPFSDLGSCDGDNGYIYSTADYLDYGGRLFTGKISLEGLEKPALTFYTYNIGGADINTISVLVNETCNSEFETVLLPATPINEISAEEGWIKVTVDLNAYKGKTIQLAFDSMVKQYKYTMFDAIKVADMLDYDLFASKIQAPANVATSTPFEVNVTVSNEGALEATDYTVELYADGTKVAEKAGEAVASGAKAVVTFEQEFTDVQVDAVIYQAKVVYAADLNAANNTSDEILVAPKISNLPAPTDVKAEKAGNGVKLTWAEPNLTYSPSVTEDFENAEAFAQTYGDWTFVDADASEVGGFQGIDLPGITPGTSKLAFFVFDAAGDEFNQTFDAHSGTKYLAGMFRYDDGTVDDWMISPALSGAAQTVSFFAKSYSASYPDAFEVWYSTGSLDPADFVQVVNKTEATDEWTEYSANLPEGAKHFAIRSCATSSFMIMVDDVTYAPEGSGELTLVGYDVYRNGAKINTATVEETSFTDAEGKDGDIYNVVAIFTIGKSAPSASVIYHDYSGLDELEGGVKIAAANGVITVTGAEGLMVSVVAVDGKLLYNAEGNATVNVLPGVYVVKAGEKVAKVLVK